MLKIKDGYFYLDGKKLEKQKAKKEFSKDLFTFNFNEFVGIENSFNVILSLKEKIREEDDLEKIIIEFLGQEEDYISELFYDKYSYGMTYYTNKNYFMFILEKLYEDEEFCQELFSKMNTEELDLLNNKYLFSEFLTKVFLKYCSPSEGISLYLKSEKVYLKDYLQDFIENCDKKITRDLENKIINKIISENIPLSDKIKSLYRIEKSIRKKTGRNVKLDLKKRMKYENIDFNLVSSSINITDLFIREYSEFYDIIYKDLNAEKLIVILKDFEKNKSIIISEFVLKHSLIDLSFLNKTSTFVKKDQLEFFNNFFKNNLRNGYQKYSNSNEFKKNFWYNFKDFLIESSIKNSAEDLF